MTFSTEAKDSQLTSRYCMVEYTGQEWATLRYTPKDKHCDNKKLENTK
jgi:hypothetical protein